MSIKVNDKVRIVDNECFSLYNGAVGEVLQVYDVNPPVAYVVLDDNRAGFKIPVSSLVKIEPREVVEDNKSLEIPTGAKQITKVDFGKALSEITSPERLLKSNGGTADFTKLITAKIIGDKIKDIIFKDSDAVIMTEEEFILALWNACNPVLTNKIVADKMRVRDCVSVSVAGVIGLRDIIDILFGESEK